ncbi:hypothetical protein [Microbacterium imperiale]|uniref:Uncharacterized protein n=1 Tax=Microbacterium imperiale TaxID=33884 RepID=A0A9W6M2C6_9MICO|nr:hypothetical protein [Microbacterium imperiale]MBP2420020.1 hypothetical protein [Microbacterium imperiale]MDS0198116.1 hypothetical protein [Microbacterium imperiale]BFE40362.1 hypothetical protein GCM10017544_13180 [Microbacterium imperiale]GLJ78662.1 hypothetical protein GCM10017586_03440 [Microbacterium imperiale]
MNRLQLRASAALRRPPFRARRAAAGHHTPLEYSPAAPAPRWLIVGGGVLGVAGLVELIVGVAVIA